MSLTKLIQRLVFSGLLTSCSASYAEVFVVIGSFMSPDEAQQTAAKIADELAVDLVVQSAEVSGRDWYRVMFPQRQSSEMTLERLRQLNVQPWRINLEEATKKQQRHDEVTTLAKVRNGDKVSFLVADFGDVSSALELERRLVELGVPVFGKAELIEDQIVHQVWIGPVSENEALVGQLKAGGLASVAAQLMSVGEQLEEPVTREEPANSNNRIPAPAGYNPARLPPKRP